jgi:hypothetical protein
LRIRISERPRTPPPSRASIRRGLSVSIVPESMVWYDECVVKVDNEGLDRMVRCFGTGTKEGGEGKAEQANGECRAVP